MLFFPCSRPSLLLCSLKSWVRCACSWWVKVSTKSLRTIERFSFECRKEIGFAWTSPHAWLKKLAPLFHPIRIKPEPVVTYSHSLSRALHPLHYYFELIGSLDCLCPLWLARVITLVFVGLVLRHSIENRSKDVTSFCNCTFQWWVTWSQVTHNFIMFCCVTADVANRIISSNEHRNTLVRCCESSGHEGVKSEASRMLAVIVKEAKSAGN